MSKEEKSKELRAQIEYWLVKENYSKSDLAFKLNISLASLYNKLKNIDKFTYGEITKLIEILMLPQEKRIQILT